MRYIIDGLMNYCILLVFLVIIELFIYKFYKKQNLIVSKGFCIGFQVFAFLIILILSITNSGGINEVGSFGDSIIRLDEINLIPFYWVSNDLFGLIMNIILFVPVGILVPLLWKNNSSLKNTVFIGFVFSLFIEVSQLFNFRATDIDYLLMNTLGSALGYFIYYLFFRKLQLFKVENNSDNWFIKNSALVSILSILLFYFFIGKPILKYALFVIYSNLY